MINIPKIKMGIVAVSRDCFPIALSQTRRGEVVAALKIRRRRNSRTANNN